VHFTSKTSYVAYIVCLTLNLLTTTIVAPPSNASKWQMGFNSAFKGLIILFLMQLFLINCTLFLTSYTVNLK
jgi:hypothetical protein